MNQKSPSDKPQTFILFLLYVESCHNPNNTKRKKEFENQWATENSMHPDMVH
jgi:hypothetical protein